MKALRSGVRWLGARLTWLRSLRVRVFLAILVVGMVPVLVGLGWLVLVEVTNRPPPSDPAANENAVLRAWSGARGAFDSEHELEVSAMRMKGRLTDQELTDLMSHLRALIGASDGAYQYAEVSIGELSSSDRPVLVGDALRRLRSNGYFWGQGEYHYYDPSTAVADGDSFEVMTLSQVSPMVAWMSSQDRVSYVQVVPTAAETGPTSFYPPVWWLAAVTGVALVALAGIALFATLLGTRGVAKPLRRMAEASDLIRESKDAAPVPVTGPPEMRRLVTAFNLMAERTARAQEAEQSFLLSVSHELKTPLTAIQGYGETLTEGRADPKTAGEVITKEASRLKRLVQDVLDLGRARKSSFTVREEPVDLVAVAREVEQRYAGRARDFGLDLRVETAGAAPVIADPDRVLQVVSNLVENALRCTPAEGVVTINATSGEVRVIDTGPGLNRDDLARAFERFFLYERCSKDRQVGSGLGLSIVKELTEAMGGSVAVESRLGEGTTFVVRLRAAGDSPA
jgi:signal transduction histidine kinase